MVLLTVASPQPLTDLEGRWQEALLDWLDGLRPEASLVARIDQLIEGMDWLRHGGQSRVLGVLRGRAPAWEVTRRLRLLLQTLEARPLDRPAFLGLVRSVLAEAGGTALYETGLPNDRGLLEETTDRLALRFLPTPRDAKDLGQLVFRLFPSNDDAAWLRELPVELITRFLDVIAAGAPQNPFTVASEMLRDACALIGTRAAGIGLTGEIRARSEPTAVRESPFFRLTRACNELADAGPWTKNAALAVQGRIAECRATMPVVLAHLEEFGVSVDVVYRVEVINKGLDRLDELLLTVVAADAEERCTAKVRLLADLVEARVRSRSLGDLTRTNLRLLARKIIERSGQTGEHYITVTRREYGRMLLSAGGGGLLTAGTCVLKYLISWGNFPLFVSGTFAAANYASSFLVMQLLGFTLATKQPSMTAAALAGALRGSSKEQDLESMVTLITRITRSQLAAAVGNIVLVIPAAIAFHWLHRRLTGHAFLDAADAEYTLHSIHPWKSGTLYFATLTGVFLWFSSVGAGWLENWAVFRRLPESLADSPVLRRLLGERRTLAIGRWLPRNISGIGGNITLGVLMGMMPVIGKFLGVPLEVRHVTLSTGALTLAACSLGREALTGAPFFAAVVGIAAIGALNFGVSFALALTVALRAREIDRPWRRRLLAAVFWRFVRSPHHFVFPPRTVAAPIAPDVPAHGT